LDIMLFALLIIALDQVSKYAIKIFLRPYDSIEVIKGIFNITYVQNSGAAFSILKGKTHFFTITTLLVIIAIIYAIIKLPTKKRGIRVLLALVLGGAVGNLIDRLRYGYVVDFLDFRIWPVFNVADMAIVISVLILAYFIAFDKNFMDFYGKTGR
jgi:signal peptidase II